LRELIIELVSLNDRVSMVPAMAQRLDASKRGTYRSVPEVVPTGYVGMIWNSYWFQSKLLEGFKEVLRWHTRALVPQA
jgi:LysR family hydrogen peroxide-inducible transcriptional activator